MFRKSKFSRFFVIIFQPDMGGQTKTLQTTFTNKSAKRERNLGVTYFTNFYFYSKLFKN